MPDEGQIIPDRRVICVEREVFHHDGPLSGKGKGGMMRYKSEFAEGG